MERLARLLVVFVLLKGGEMRVFQGYEDVTEAYYERIERDRQECKDENERYLRDLDNEKTQDADTKEAAFIAASRLDDP